MSKVAVVRGTDPSDLTIKALEIVNAAEVIPAARPVLIKPNYINTKHPSTGITTDGRVIEGVVKFLTQHNVKDIVVGEGTGHGDTLEAFKVAGVDKIAQKWNVRMVDLNRDEMVQVAPPNSVTLRKVKVARTVLESTIISVAKLKPHRLTTVTLSIKNMMGAVTPKASMHTHLNQNIADLVSIVKPRIAVIDGIIAGEGHETSGNPVEMNLVIAGTDPVSVDAVGASIMCVDPSRVRHLRLAEKKGLGVLDLEQIEILGEPVEAVKRKFRRSLI